MVGPDRLAEPRRPHRRHGGRRVHGKPVAAVSAARVQAAAEPAAEPDVGQETLPEVLGHEAVDERVDAAREVGNIKFFKIF